MHLLSPSIPLLALRASFSKNLQYFPTPWQVPLAQFQKADPTAQARMGIRSLSSFCKPGSTTQPSAKGAPPFWAGQGSPVWDLLFLHTFCTRMVKIHDSCLPFCSTSLPLIFALRLQEAPPPAKRPIRWASLFPLTKSGAGSRAAAAIRMIQCQDPEVKDRALPCAVRLLLFAHSRRTRRDQTQSAKDAACINHWHVTR